MKLLYFPFPVRAEAIRLALKAGGVTFEDARCDPSEWPAIKPTTPRGQVPTLTLDDGSVVTESVALLRLAGALGTPRLYPAEAVAAARVDEAVDILRAAVEALVATHAPGLSVAEQARLGAAALSPGAPVAAVLAWADAAVEGNPAGPYVVGSGLSIADCLLKVIADWVTGPELAAAAFKGALDAYPRVRGAVAATSAVPTIAAYEAALKQ